MNEVTKFLSSIQFLLAVLLGATNGCGTKVSNTGKPGDKGSSQYVAKLDFSEFKAINYKDLNVSDNDDVVANISAFTLASLNSKKKVPLRLADEKEYRDSIQIGLSKIHELKLDIEGKDNLENLAIVAEVKQKDTALFRVVGLKDSSTKQKENTYDISLANSYALSFLEKSSAESLGTALTSIDTMVKEVDLYLRTRISTLDNRDLALMADQLVFLSYSVEEFFYYDKDGSSKAVAALAQSADLEKLRLAVEGLAKPFQTKTSYLSKLSSQIFKEEVQDSEKAKIDDQFDENLITALGTNNLFLFIGRADGTSKIHLHLDDAEAPKPIPDPISSMKYDHPVKDFAIFGTTVATLLEGESQVRISHYENSTFNKVESSSVLKINGIPRDVKLYKDHAFVNTQDGLYIFDSVDLTSTGESSDETNPLSSIMFDEPIYQIAVTFNILCIAGKKGAYIYDVSNVNKPTPIGDTVAGDFKVVDVIGSDCFFGGRNGLTVVGTSLNEGLEVRHTDYSGLGKNIKDIKATDSFILTAHDAGISSIRYVNGEFVEIQGGIDHRVNNETHKVTSVRTTAYYSNGNTLTGDQLPVGSLWLFEQKRDK